MIYIVGYNSINNPRNWSGTPYNLKKVFDSLGIDYQYIDFSINRNLLRFYFMVWSRLFFVYNTCRNYFWNRFAEKSFISKTRDIISEKHHLLFIADYCIPKEVKGKCNYSTYIDACHYNLMEYMPHKKLGYSKFQKFYFKKSKEYLSRMSMVFTQNEWTKEALIRNYNFKSDKIFNIGFGINVEPFLGEKEFDNDLLLIVLRKGTEKYKGLFLLLDAFKQVKEKHPQAQLAVVGTNVGAGQSGVTCYYNQPRSVTVELFQKSSLYVMPALHEPNGITYLEALANKTPIVGLDRFAFPEFSGYGKWGFIVQNEDPAELAGVIVDALNDKNKLHQMGIAGQKFVTERYQWDLVAGKIINAILDHDKKETAVNA